MAAGKVPGEDFLCMSTPGEGFLYNVDSFAMFAVEGDNKQAGQALLAELVVGESFQEVFNLNKGSIPVRTDVALDRHGSKQRRWFTSAFLRTRHGASRRTGWRNHRYCDCALQL